jgi:hypothetical protein
MFSPGSKTSNSRKESGFGRLGRGKDFGGSLTSINAPSQKAGSIRDEKLKTDNIVNQLDVPAIKSKQNRQSGSNFLSPQHQ